MKRDKEVKIPFWAAHITTIVSVTLVLALTGFMAIGSLAGKAQGQRLKEKLRLTLVMCDSVSDGNAVKLAREIEASQFALNVETVTKEQALLNWKNDTGEDLEALFGANPLSPEISFSLREIYSEPATLEALSAELSQLPGVESVALPNSEMMQSITRNLKRLNIILGIIAITMLAISFVLINNTVHLSIYSRRFTIHTMQLVGATDSFIRRPYISANMLAGMVSGTFACAIIATAFLIAQRYGFSALPDLIGWPAVALTATALIASGAVLCSTAAAISTTRYLRRDYESLFRQ